ncbi:MAG: hypothetical protein H0T43_06330 [Solirubrobacterales bacterium]|nr:hypothetical protein [Solirubrobacterales bacterium]
MSTPPGSMPPGPEGPQPTEEEMRAAYEAELKRIRVEDVLVQTVVSLLNLGGRKAGLAPGTEDERDLEQVREAVEGVRALLPLVEAALGADIKQVRDALSQLQLTYARAGDGRGGEPGPGGESGGQAPPADPEPAAPPKPSGRLWVPGQ